MISETLIGFVPFKVSFLLSVLLKSYLMKNICSLFRRYRLTGITILCKARMLMSVSTDCLNDRKVKQLNERPSVVVVSVDYEVQSTCNPLR